MQIAELDNQIRKGLAEAERVGEAGDVEKAQQLAELADQQKKVRREHAEPYGEAERPPARLPACPPVRLSAAAAAAAAAFPPPMALLVWNELARELAFLIRSVPRSGRRL